MGFAVWLEINNYKLTTGKRGRQKGQVVLRKGTGRYESLHTGGSDRIREIGMYASGSHKKA